MRHEIEIKSKEYGRGEYTFLKFYAVCSCQEFATVHFRNRIAAERMGAHHVEKMQADSMADLVATSDALTHMSIDTRNPGHYRLVNVNDGTVWVWQAGQWVQSTPTEMMDRIAEFVRKM